MFDGYYPICLAEYHGMMQLAYGPFGDALAAAARKSGDVKQAPGEAPQSGGDQPQRPTSSIVEGN